MFTLLAREHPKLPPPGETGTKMGTSEPIFVTDEGTHTEIMHIFIVIGLFPSSAPCGGTFPPRGRFWCAKQ